MKNTATHVMTPSVYGVDDAFVIVRLLAASLLAGSKPGQSTPNNVTVVATIVERCPATAQPSGPLAP